MTWRTQLGERTLRGAEADLIREALGGVVDMVEAEIAGYADPWEYGVVDPGGSLIAANTLG